MSSALVRKQKLESLLIMLRDFSENECTASNRAPVAQCVEIVKGILKGVK